jgi:hypothetical protein
MPSTSTYAPRAHDWLLGVALAMTAGVIAGFPTITEEFHVEALTGVTIAVGIVGALGILGCWVTGSMFGRRPWRGVPWIVGAVVLWLAQVALLPAVGWRIAVPTAGFLAAAVVVAGWLNLHHYAAATYAWLAVLVVGAVVAGLSTSYPQLVAVLVVTPLVTMFGASATQSLAARRHSAAA